MHLPLLMPLPYTYVFNILNIIHAFLNKAILNHANRIKLTYQSVGHCKLKMSSLCQEKCFDNCIIYL